MFPLSHSLSHLVSLSITLSTFARSLSFQLGGVEIKYVNKGVHGRLSFKRNFHLRHRNKANKKIFESISVGHNENSSFVLSLYVILHHYCDVIMGAMASEITSLTIVYSTVYSGANQRKHQSSVSLAFGRGIHRGPVNYPHKWPLTRRMFPFENLGMLYFISFLWQRERLHHMDDVHKELYTL